MELSDREIRTLISAEAEKLHHGTAPWRDAISKMSKQAVQSSLARLKTFADALPDHSVI